ncbi:hypothetical protein NXT3_PC01169 (plasmid) [Sinorhizobium fredii]|uniref:Uncharacterized protein n=2 Tax=Sinorhizobium TaxID=28105 RepID=A0A2L0HFT1_RHIFR|nr:hypothetical protein NXT3_PC01169 [Sinorhizobium fredii]
MSLPKPLRNFGHESVRAADIREIAGGPCLPCRNMAPSSACLRQQLGLRMSEKPEILNQVLADLISDQIELRHANELRAVLSTGNEITMHGKFTVGRDFIIYRTTKDDSGKWAMTPFTHIVQLII